jgi:hypothetical protein
MIRRGLARSGRARDTSEEKRFLTVSGDDGDLLDLRVAEALARIEPSTPCRQRQPHNA